MFCFYILYVIIPTYVLQWIKQEQNGEANEFTWYTEWTTEAGGHDNGRTAFDPGGSRFGKDKGSHPPHSLSDRWTWSKSI